jgi:hypothetical protein
VLEHIDRYLIIAGRESVEHHRTQESGNGAIMSPFAGPDETPWLNPEAERPLFGCSGSSRRLE